MANYKLDYTGEQVNTAIGNALSGGGTQLHNISIYAQTASSVYYLDENFNVANISINDATTVTIKTIKIIFIMSNRNFIKASNDNCFVKQHNESGLGAGFYLTTAGTDFSSSAEYYFKGDVTLTLENSMN